MQLPEDSDYPAASCILLLVKAEDTWDDTRIPCAAE